MRLPHPMCLLRSVMWSLRTALRTGYQASGHSYVLAEEHDGCHVEVLRCKVCGHISVGWSKKP